MIQKTRIIFFESKNHKIREANRINSTGPNISEKKKVSKVEGVSNINDKFCFVMLLLKNPLLHHLK